MSIRIGGSTGNSVTNNPIAKQPMQATANAMTQGDNLQQMHQNPKKFPWDFGAELDPKNKSLEKSQRKILQYYGVEKNATSKPWASVTKDGNLMVINMPANKDTTKKAFKKPCWYLRPFTWLGEKISGKPSARLPYLWYKQKCKDTDFAMEDPEHLRKGIEDGRYELQLIFAKDQKTGKWEKMPQMISTLDSLEHAAEQLANVYDKLGTEVKDALHMGRPNARTFKKAFQGHHFIDHAWMPPGARYSKYYREMHKSRSYIIAHALAQLRPNQYTQFYLFEDENDNPLAQEYSRSIAPGFKRAMYQKSKKSWKDENKTLSIITPYTHGQIRIPDYTAQVLNRIFVNSSTDPSVKNKKHLEKTLKDMQHNADRIQQMQVSIS